MTSRRIIIGALWSGVVLLALIGVVASALRSISVVERTRAAGTSTDLSRLDSLNLQHGAKLLHIEPGTPPYVAGWEQTRSMMAKFYSYPNTTLLHVVPGALFMLLAPFQFSRRIRARHIRVHRWSGRILVAVMVPVALSGLFFGLFMPFSGTFEALAVGLFGGYLLFAITRAFIAIRKKDVEHHREWMIRMFSVAIGVSMQRVVAIALAMVYREGPETWFAQSVWLGFVLTVVAGELWIRTTRRPTISASEAVLPVSRPVASSTPTPSPQLIRDT